MVIAHDSPPSCSMSKMALGPRAAGGAALGSRFFRAASRTPHTASYTVYMYAKQSISNMVPYIFPCQHNPGFKLKYQL